MRNHLPLFPEPITKIVIDQRHYTLMIGCYQERFANDTCASSMWDVYLGTEKVAMIHEGTYGQGRYAVSMNQIRWAGPFPSDHYDPRFHDLGPSDSLLNAFERTIEACNRIIDYRKSLAA